MEYPKFKVCCRCFTFNQSKYITDTMNGFTMQQTNFPFVCIIVDDASNDGEQDVIKQYVEEHFDLSDEGVSYTKETDYAYIIYAQHKTNKNCYFAVLFLRENHFSIRKSKLQYLNEWRDMCDYEAMCEGDDFWIDSDKIQKQYNFLLTNSDYVMCFTDFNIYYEDTERMEESLLKKQPDAFPHEYTIKEWVFAKKYVGPMTWMYRTKVIDNVPKLNSPDGTFVWFAYFLCHGKVHCMLDYTSAVYRYCASGITHSKSIRSIYRRSIGMLKCQLQLVKLYIPNEFDKLSKELSADWSNQNIHLSFYLKDEEGISILKNNLFFLTFKSKILYYCYMFFPSLLNFIYKRHLEHKGIIYITF